MSRNINPNGRSNGVAGWRALRRLALLIPVVFLFAAGARAAMPAVAAPQAVTLTVTVAASGVGVAVVGTSPLAVSATSGSSVTFTATLTNPQANCTPTYQWTFANGNPTTGIGITAASTFFASGSGFVIVSDSCQNSGNATFIVNINTTGTGAGCGAVGNSIGLTATANGTPNSYNASVNQSIVFNAVTNVGLSSPTWNFGDGATGSGPSFPHTYTSSGTFTATFTAFGNGTQACTSVTVFVGTGTGTGAGSCVQNPQTGNPIFVTVSAQNNGNTITFTANWIGTVPPQTVAWSFGDGATQAATTFGGSQAVATHTYTTTGSYSVYATVADSRGFQSCNNPGTGYTVNVSGGTGTGTGAGNIRVAPNGTYSGGVGQTICFGGFAQTYNQGATITSYSWSFGDGTNGTGQLASHAYSAANTYTVTLTVTDSTGQSNSASTTAMIGVSSIGSQICSGSSSTGGTGSGTVGQNSERGVTVSTGGPYSGTPGTAINFTGSATTTNGGATINSYSWNFGDGQSGTSQNTTHTYSTSGSFTLVLTVTDSTGVAVAATASVSIGSSGGSTGGTRQIQLVIGCNNVASTFADSTNTSTVANGVSPQSALLSIWKLSDPATSKYKAYFPGATQATDLPSVNRLDAVFICVNATATLNEPSA